MERCSKMRTRIISEPPVRYMDKLDEFILIEILQRLPSVRSVTQCKLVCPHWNSVISCPHFSTRFLKHHPTKKEFSMILVGQLRTVSTCTLLSDDHKFAVSVLESTPCNHTTLDLEILATYNDLLLCLHRYRCDSDVDLDRTVRRFYIYNPLTRQHVALPPSPVAPRCISSVLVGLLWRGQSSFRVVNIFREHPVSHRVSMHIFSSEENKWMEYSLGSNDRIVNYSYAMGVPWNGLLCWMAYRNLNHIIVCNPYNPEGQHFHFITTPPEVRIVRENIRVGVGVFGGALRLWHQDQRLGVLSVWELKDYSTEEWSLKHRVRMCLSHNIRAAALDPNDENVVYYTANEAQNSIISLNMRTRMSSWFEARLKTSFNLPRFKDDPWIKGCILTNYNHLNLFMLVMREGFPTPVTTLTESQDQGLETSEKLSR